MTTKETITKARALIARGWTQHFYARAEDDDVTNPISEHACRWCLIGAIKAVTHNNDNARDDAVIALADAGILDPIGWNDSRGRTQAEVVALLDRVMERLP